MNSKQLFIISLRSLKHHKGRSFLTILGIIIGIASIIAILGIGHGAEEKIRREILSAGDNFIYLHAGNWLAEGKVKSTKQKRIKQLTFRDIEIFKKQIAGIRKITPDLYMTQRISHQKNTIVTEVKGGNQDLLEIIGRKIKRGSFFNEYHVQKCARVIALGHKAAHDLFKLVDPIGKTVQIQGMNFTVIAVISKVEIFFGAKDPNAEVFIPISTGKKYLDSRRYDPHKIGGIALSATTAQAIQGVVKQLRKTLRAQHNLEVGDPDDFMIYDQLSMAKAAQASSNILTLLLLIIASISLLVGGIGVMNIMLVSVSERTKEIGIRMALGAQDHIILRQFLIEAIVLCLLGGLTGICFGIVVPHIASFFTGWLVIIKSSSILLAFLTIFMVGLLFGYYPARKASRLDPVEALLDR